MSSNNVYDYLKSFIPGADECFVTLKAAVEEHTNKPNPIVPTNLENTPPDEAISILNKFIEKTKDYEGSYTNFAKEISRTLATLEDLTDLVNALKVKFKEDIDEMTHLRNTALKMIMDKEKQRYEKELETNSFRKARLQTTLTTKEIELKKRMSLSFIPEDLLVSFEIPVKVEKKDQTDKIDKSETFDGFSKIETVFDAVEKVEKQKLQTCNDREKANGIQTLQDEQHVHHKVKLQPANSAPKSSNSSKERTINIENPFNRTTQIAKPGSFPEYFTLSHLSTAISQRDESAKFNPKLPQKMNQTVVKETGGLIGSLDANSAPAFTPPKVRIHKTVQFNSEKIVRQLTVNNAITIGTGLSEIIWIKGNVIGNVIGKIFAISKDGVSEIVFGQNEVPLRCNQKNTNFPEGTLFETDENELFAYSESANTTWKFSNGNLSVLNVTKPIFPKNKDDLLEIPLPDKSLAKVSSKQKQTTAQIGFYFTNVDVKAKNIFKTKTVDRSALCFTSKGLLEIDPTKVVCVETIPPCVDAAVTTRGVLLVSKKKVYWVDFEKSESLYVNLHTDDFFDKNAEYTSCFANGSAIMIGDNLGRVTFFRVNELF
ncbi:hypothetical protein EIN_378180 [Entamoeba invadens IP1]|uniref:Uncharacterized protein n=1 Tax=Entamoeba invadens IP1 TaxID=370355 RepID=A0A0A1TW63_ENTIV|nr:hypothetical protein EIN_378180 [Entamoeba invadens IP1]ELP83523.1 hypothetical protein EIN_378180 [Entamoeba invadens IP1]|eukprot:XP_004182869.1 hypothetical protein EIN_378180 [Entamoeba invadens IP1]